MPALGRLYQDTLRTLDLDDPPAALFGVYAGDRIAGNGAHYTGLWGQDWGDSINYTIPGGP